MGTFLKSEDDESSYVPVNAFLFAHIYLKRPKAPPPQSTKSQLIRNLSLSLALGTKISKGFFDDLFIGVCISQILWLSNLGVVAGLNFKLPMDDLNGDGELEPTGKKDRTFLYWRDVHILNGLHPDLIREKWGTENVSFVAK